MNATMHSYAPGGKLQVNDVEIQRASAIRLLSKDTSSKAKAIKIAIESIVPEKATRRDIKRLMALCRKVSVYYRVDLRDAITA